MRNQDGATTLSLAAAHGHEEIVLQLQYMMPEGEDEWETLLGQQDYLVGQTALHVAAQWGHAGVMRVLCESSWDVECLLHIPDHGGQTALHTAACEGHDNVAWVIFDFTTDVESLVAELDWQELNVLHVAAYHGQVSVIMCLEAVTPEWGYLLCSQGGSWQATALHMAVDGGDHGHPDVVEKLAELAPDPAELFDSRDIRSQTALHWAAAGGREYMVCALCENAPERAELVSAVDDDWRTVLHVAAEGGQIDVIRMLLGVGDTFGAPRRVLAAFR